MTKEKRYCNRFNSSNYVKLECESNRMWNFFYRSNSVMLDSPTYLSPCRELFSKYWRTWSPHDVLQSFERPLLLLLLLFSFQAFITSVLERCLIVFATTGIMTVFKGNRITTEVNDVDPYSYSTQRITLNWLNFHNNQLWRAKLWWKSWIIMMTLWWWQAKVFRWLLHALQMTL